MTASWIIQVGAFAAALTAVITLIGAIARSPLGRWLARSITEDLREKRRSEIDDALEPVMEMLGPIKAQVLPNGGSSMADRVARTEQRVDDTHELVLLHIADQSMHISGG